MLNACSLILLQQQTSDSTVGSFTDTPPPPPEEHFNESTDYVDIDEYQQSHSRQNGGQIKTQSVSQIYEQSHECETNTYASHNNRLNGVGVAGERDEREDEENQRLYYNNKQEMGQSLSIRRPRISLTWVLREQSQNQQQQQQQQNEQQQQQQNTKKEEEKPTKEEKKENFTDLNNVLNNNQIVNNRVNKLDRSL